MKLIQQNLLNIKKRILSACKKFGKDEKKIILVAVSKKKSINLIKEAIDCNQFIFAESYVQEGIKKVQYFSDYKKLSWHFIGQIQSNKVKFISKNFSWCQSVDKINLAEKLNLFRPENLKPLNVLIQVNITKEKNKSGVFFDKIDELADKINQLPKLKFRGLMAIPSAKENYNEKILTFTKISQLMFNLKKTYENCDVLSLGMSQDLETAISVGSNMLRIGTSIFGIRCN